MTSEQLEQVAQLCREIEALGFEVQVTPQSTSNGRTSRRSKSPQAIYHQELRKIREEHGGIEKCPLKKARHIYRKRQQSFSIGGEVAPVKKKRRRNVNAANATKKYWRSIRKLAKQHGVDNVAARKIYNEQAA